MNNIGLSTRIEEGSTGQFELFKHKGENFNIVNNENWISFLKEGHGKFFSLEDVTNKLEEMR
tara:strand:+ start:305 stop:490 length:186 start_codon:yes stop_codon:yes gene_type:complete